MKIVVTKTEVFDFDYDKEIERLKECFKGEQLQRQLDFINAALIEKNLEKAGESYDDMPYDEDEECSEKEYVGLWTGIVWGSGMNFHYWMMIDRDTQIEIDDDKNGIS